MVTDIYVIFLNFIYRHPSRAFALHSLYTCSIESWSICVCDMVFVLVVCITETAAA